MATIGPSFPDELRAAGISLDGIAWSADGGLTFAPGVPPPIQAQVAAIVAGHDPTTMALADALAAKWAAGCAVTFTGAPELTATYALDDRTLTEIGSLARDIASGLGFPKGATSFTYPDMAGQPHSFTEAQFRQLYAALRDYVFDVRTAYQTALMSGQAAVWPAQPVTVA